MKTTSYYGKYSRLFLLNRRLFAERFKLDAPLILIGLFYVFANWFRLRSSDGISNHQKEHSESVILPEIARQSEDNTGTVLHFHHLADPWGFYNTLFLASGRGSDGGLGLAVFSVNSALSPGDLCLPLH
ncbi:MAG: hypothetical protein ACE5OR_01185 [bacterium]